MFEGVKTLMIRILFAASEAVPFAKTGGLGEVVGSLPAALRELGLDVRVIMPKYGTIAQTYRDKMKPVLKTTVSVTWRNQYCGIEEINEAGQHYYFVDNEYYFRRDGLYGYYDEAERFVFFCRTVLHCLPLLGFKPDIIHCHDWQTGLIPLYLQQQRAHNSFYTATKTVFTIHNLKYQGVFTHWILHNLLGLGDEYFNPGALEYYGQVNLMKSGIAFSDLLTTVSRTYAEEIKHPFFGEGLDGLIKEKEGKFCGILNGIDYQKYDPQKDPHLYMNYSDSLAAKSENKIKLQEELGLPTGKNIPVLGLVSRMTPQKGLDLLLCIFQELMELEIQIVILGTGEHKYESFFSHTTQIYPGKCRYIREFNEALARRIYAAADLYLMPSLFEPCGLSQLIALRYGSLPVVRETGGLKDTVKPYNEETKEGNGFSFTNYNAHDFLYTIKGALEIYRSKKDVWERIFLNARREDFSWKKSALLYRDLYAGLSDAGLSSAKVSDAGLRSSGRRGTGLNGGRK